MCFHYGFGIFSDFISYFHIIFYYIFYFKKIVYNSHRKGLKREYVDQESEKEVCGGEGGGFIFSFRMKRTSSYSTGPIVNFSWTTLSEYSVFGFHCSSV